MSAPVTSKLETTFAEPGTLRPPGPVGRAVRLVFGVLILLTVVSLLPNVEAALRRTALPSHPSWWIGVAIGLWVFPYVVNIGFTVSWRWWPRVLVATALGLSIVAPYALTGATWSPVAGALFLTFFFYTYGHLGISFLLASLIATPGCEMRAIPHLWSLLSRRATKEHNCPGVLDPIDRWETRRRWA